MGRSCLRPERAAFDLVSEIIATAGLVLVIFSLTRTGRADEAAGAVAAYIGAAHLFTSSTSFANPAITIGRMFSDTFAGVAPSSAPLFMAAQVIGGAAALLLVRALYSRTMASMPTNAAPEEAAPVAR